MKQCTRCDNPAVSNKAKYFNDCQCNVIDERTKRTNDRIYAKNKANREKESKEGSK